MKNVITITMVMLFCLYLGSAYGSNLIQNGDFELGNAAFYTDYLYSPLDIVEEAQYTIDTDPAHAHPKSGSYSDHTTGSGNMMIVNASTSYGKIVWQQAVPVATNTDYNFSFWCMNWSAISYSLARLEYSINGVSMGTITVPSNQGIWEQTSAIWDSQSSSLATIKIIETARYYVGSDFAIDDITMVPEPATITLLAIGGLFLCKRK
jgi:hypothetical protein